MNQSKRYWMVQGDGPTVFTYTSLKEAQKVAVESAQKNPGERFYILETVAHAECDKPSVRYDLIPPDPPYTPY